MNSRKWTEREEKLLKQLYPCFQRHDITSDELCAVLNRSMDSITNRASKLGITGKAWDDINEELLAKLKKEGKVKI